VSRKLIGPCLGVAALLLVGCGAAGGSPVGVTSPTPTASGSGPVAGPTRVPLLTPPLGADVVTLRDQDDGHTVTVTQGTRLAVLLNSTYWVFQGSSNPAVVRTAGDPVVRPGGICPPGGGCGTALQLYDAVGPGQAQLAATRTSCGEARNCGPDQANYRVVVIVRA
jgi:hypothetical protein